jgi:hypothetical protein
MLSLLTVFQLAQLYLPGDNFFNSSDIAPPPYNITIGNSSVIPTLSNTQTLQDFESVSYNLDARWLSLEIWVGMNRDFNESFQTVA